MGELDFIRWIRRRLPRDHDVLVDAGHDAACVRLGRERVIFKVDQVVEGVHFMKADPPRWVGHKAMARPISDFAATACAPRFAVVSMAMPRLTSIARARGLFDGMNRTARKFGVRIVGGDVSATAGPLTIGVSMIGRAEGAPVTRSGARPGDLLCVTGPLGGSIRGKHLRFTPRLKEGLALRGRVHAIIDVSDGLARDLAHLCEESRVGADLYAWQIPIACGTLDNALYDGEDYELLFAAEAREALHITKDTDAVVIGRVTRARRLRIIEDKPRPLPIRGYEHDFGRR